MVADRGYAGASVASVIERSGVWRATFYQHFPNREQCFLAAYDEIVTALLAVVARATTEASGGWLDRIAAGLRAYLRFLTEHPAHARTLIVEVAAAGTGAARRRHQVDARFVVLLKTIYCQARREHPEPAPLGEHVFIALVGAISELVPAGPAGVRPQLRRPDAGVRLGKGPGNPGRCTSPPSARARSSTPPCSHPSGSPVGAFRPW